MRRVKCKKIRDRIEKEAKRKGEEIQEEKKDDTTYVGKRERAKTNL